MAIELPEGTKKELVSSLKSYFLDERDEDMGDLQASLMLDFILMEIGPSIYNQGIRDAQAGLQRAVADLDVTLTEPEFAYTTEKTSRRNAAARR